MATRTSPPANPYGNFAVSGNTAAGIWCGGCGRKLAYDGRCDRCDTWHASPLVQVGAPLVAVTTVLVAILIGTLRGPSPVVSAAAPAMPSPLIAAPPVFRPAVLFAPPSAPPAVTAFPLTPMPYRADPGEAPAAAGFAELERLRSLSHYVDAALAADAATRVPAPVLVPVPNGKAVSSVLPIAY
jgi:hypothetical protein